MKIIILHSVVGDGLDVSAFVALLARVRNRFAIKPRMNAKVTGTIINQKMIEGIILSPHQVLPIMQRTARNANRIS